MVTPAQKDPYWAENSRQSSSSQRFVHNFNVETENIIISIPQNTQSPFFKCFSCQ